MKKYFITFLVCSVALSSEEYSPQAQCEKGPREGKLTLRHKEPGGIGYNQGYTSLDFFYAPSLNQNSYSFIDLRGHIFDDGKWASNAGLGLRVLPDCQKIVYGANLYWDWRDAGHARFQQLSAGLEVLGPNWDLRVDGYAPVNRYKKSYHEGVEKKYQLAMWGIDAVVGYWLWRSGSFGIHGSLGGYYFKGDFNQRAGGGLLGAEARFTDWISLKAQVSYDNLFKWNAQGEIALNIPFGRRAQHSRNKTVSCSDFIALEKRLVEQPERFEIIVTSNHP